MAYGYASVLGSIALAVSIAAGILQGAPAPEVLLRGLIGMAMFAPVGYLAGCAADHLVRHDLEWRFRQRVAAFREEIGADEDRDDDAQEDGAPEPR